MAKTTKGDEPTKKAKKPAAKKKAADSPAPAPPAIPAKRGKPVEVHLYDFKRPHRVSKERLRTLEAMYERLVKSLEGWLMARVRGQVEITLAGVDQCTYGEFTTGLPTPCTAYIFDILDSGGQKGVVELGNEFASVLVDRLFGGRGEPMILERGLTPLERMAVRMVPDRTIALVTEIWKEHVDLQLRLSGFEAVPEILRTSGAEDPVLVATLNVESAGISSRLQICLPFAVIDKFFSDTGGRRLANVTGSEREREANRALAEASLRSALVPISARLPAFRIPMRELAALKVGNVISTGIPCNAQVQVKVNDQPRYTGAAARMGRKLAVSIVDSLRSEVPGQFELEPEPGRPISTSEQDV
ncbi:MAG TPA: FliM/FliN family flagellar motor switch protein [Longimicrobiaceae bacterium]|nr:FliM/FliN family flagellar motor switch protein [Longimicrobiaceae bacterium]